MRRIRNDIPATTVNKFCQKIASSTVVIDQQSETLHIDGSTFIYAVHNNLLLVAVSHKHVEPSMIFEYLFEKLHIISSHLGAHFTAEDVLKSTEILNDIFNERLSYATEHPSVKLSGLRKDAFDRDRDEK